MSIQELNESIRIDFETQNHQLQIKSIHKKSLEGRFIQKELSEEDKLQLSKEVEPMLYIQVHDMLPGYGSVIITNGVIIDATYSEQEPL